MHIFWLAWLDQSGTLLFGVPRYVQFWDCSLARSKGTQSILKCSIIRWLWSDDNKVFIDNQEINYGFIQKIVVTEYLTNTAP